MLSKIKNLILDMDGVLWRGETPMPGLNEFFDILEQQRINFVLATNNATKTAVQYTEKLARFGIRVPPEQIVTAAEATADYLRETYGRGTAVYVVGEPGLHQALKSRSFDICSPKAVLHGSVPALVVVGFNRQADYQLLAMATLAIHKGARFIGTNPDVTFPSEIGPMPGAGSLLAFIQSATDVTPTIVGKPGPIMFQQALKRLDGTPANTAMVGDRLNTDIAGAKAAGLPAILVLSGITRR
ncbi:MAG: HAD-IIA family hydrolase, partial [Anaerolineae bacterium]